PVGALAVERAALHVLLAQPVTLTRPDIRASAHEAQPSLPAEGLVVRGCVRFFDVVDEPVSVVLRARVTISLPRSRGAQEVAGQTGIRQIERPPVLAEVVMCVRPARFD